MTDLTSGRLMASPARPLTFTVSHDGEHWHARVWLDLNPDDPGSACALVHEVTFSCVNVPLETTHHTLWVAVALAVQDFAEGVGLPVDGA